jgi:hypothetical protein
MTMIHPEGTWSWRAYAAVLALATVPPALAGWSGGGPGSSVRALVVGEVAIAVLVLLAALASYVQYRLTEDPAMGWLCLGSMVLGARCLGVAVLQSDSGHLDHADWLVLADLTVVATLAVLTRVRCRDVDPFVPGAVVATGLAVLYLVLPERLPPVDVSQGLVLTGHAVAVVLGLLVWVHVVRTHGFVYGSVTPTVAYALLATSQVGTTHRVDQEVVSQALVALAVAGTVLLVGMTLDRLRVALSNQAEHLRLVRGRLAAAQQDLRDQQSRLHEVANSMAGIASASRLIHEDRDLDDPRRLKLEWMLDHESARLSRVLGRAHPLEAPDAPTGLADLSDRAT